MSKNKADIIIDLGLRLLVFIYSVTILALSMWQLKRDRQFLIAIGIFAVTCTAIYLFDAIYKIVTGKNIEWLQRIIYGSQEFSVDLPDLKKTFRIICYLCVLLICMYLFGIFLVIFLAMASFPVLYDRQNPFISVLVAFITTGSFYFILVNMIGIHLYRGIIFGF